MKTITRTLLAIACCTVTMLAADAKAGHAAYDTACKGCHGAAGVANPAIARMMKVDMQPLGSAAVQALSDADLAKIVTEGKGKMKPVPNAHNPADIVAFIRTLKN